MKRKIWTSRLTCLALVGVTVGGVAWAAGTQGSQTDPLVTLSYLNEVAVPDIMAQVDQKLDQREAELTQKLQTAGGSSASFEAVKVPAGKSLVLTAGTQVVLRSGTVKSTSSLTDLTSGMGSSTANLTANHLYLATAGGQKITASTELTVLVQGSYTVE